MARPKRAPVNEEQKKLLNEIYYEKKMFLGRDRLFNYIQNNHPESNISRRQLMDWLNSQETHQINRKQPRRKSTKPVTNTKLGYIQIDLIDMSNNAERGFHWILTAIDTFSKYAQAIPVKNKKADVVSRAFDKLITRFPKVSVVQSDNGGEFNSINGDFKILKSKAHSPQTQGAIERFNGTLKGMIRKSQTASGKKTWINDLPKFIDGYNNTPAKGTGQLPINVSKLEGAQEKAKNKIETARARNPHQQEVAFEKGDKVRVGLIKGKLDKGVGYSKEIFEIHKVFKAKKAFIKDSYKLIDKDENLIEGRYNASQLLKIPEKTS